MQAVIPFLWIVLNADVETFKVIHSPVSGIKNFLSCKLGLNLLFVFLLEKETWFPTIDFLPVKSQILDMLNQISKRSAKMIKIFLNQCTEGDKNALGSITAALISTH